MLHLFLKYPAIGFTAATAAIPGAAKDVTVVDNRAARTNQNTVPAFTAHAAIALAATATCAAHATANRSTGGVNNGT